MVLLAFALGWALLAVLSTRFSDQPQRWAAAPATFMAVAGLSFTQRVRGRAGGVQLGVASPVRARCLDHRSGPGQVRSRIGRWLLYPVLAVLMIAALGGGYQTVRESLDAKAYPRPAS